MAELCAVVLGISLLTCIFGQMREFHDDGYHAFADGYLEKQSEAIVLSKDQKYLSEDGKEVQFNENGNVQKAETLVYGKSDRKIIIELGGGRLVFR